MFKSSGHEHNSPTRGRPLGRRLLASEDKVSFRAHYIEDLPSRAPATCPTYSTTSSTGKHRPVTRRASPLSSHPIPASHVGTAAFAVALLRLDQKIVSGVPMTLKRMAKMLNTDAMLLQKFRDRFAKCGDKAFTIYADGRAVDIRVFR
jgi:hypothetical protein